MTPESSSKATRFTETKRFDSHRTSELEFKKQLKGASFESMLGGSCRSPYSSIRYAAATLWYSALEA